MSGELPTAGEAARLQLAMIAQPGEFIEVRWRLPRGDGMRRKFVPAPSVGGELRRLAGELIDTGQRTDLYVGAAPRRGHVGGRDGVQHSRCLWVDADTTQAVERLRAFEPAPNFLIRSGHGLHGWWALTEPLAAPRALELALRRLAHHLGADMACTDTARIMRLAGTVNHKCGVRLPVEAERVDVNLHRVAALVGDLPDPPAKRAPRPAAPRPAPAGDDALMAIEPADYIEALTGREVGADGKVACPFHADRTPSLHAYPTAGQGWRCYAGCGGGTIIDFGALLYGLEPRGVGYTEIRRRLDATVAGAAR